MENGAERTLSGTHPNTTNNRMELTAAIEALRETAPDASVILRSDSEYLVKTMNLGWKRNKNQDLWQQLDAEVAKRSVYFEWVQGHAGDRLNEQADQLARDAATGAAPAAGPPNREKEIVSRLAPMLRPGERILQCESCGSLFVDSGEALADAYCSLARCQLIARAKPRQ